MGVEERVALRVHFRPRLAEYVATAIKKGLHVLVEGELVSSPYQRPNGKGKKSATTKITSWSIHADLVRSSTAASRNPKCMLPATLCRMKQPTDQMRLGSD